jgi:phosphoglycerate dehydrogenase-like enzyme
MPRVLLMTPHLRKMEGPFRKVIQEAGMDLVVPPDDANEFDPAVLRELLRGIDGVIASTEPYTRDVLRGTSVRIIARTGVGYDAIDVAAATEEGIVVTITPGTNHDSVAESALALLLGVYRGLPWRYNQVQSGRWTRRALPRLTGKTIGLVGLGRIGKAMVLRCHGLGLRVIACDPYADAQFAAANNVRLCGFDELIAAADIVSLHLPASTTTTNLINAQTLARMKRGSVLINTSRGALVDEDALVAAVRSGHLLGAGLDVFKIEPLPLNSPLLQLDNILMLPHIAGLDEESLQSTATLAAQCIVNVLNGRWPGECAVNPEVRSHFSGAVS